MTGFIERPKFGLILTPARTIMFQRGLERLLQTEKRAQSRFLRKRSEADRQNGLAALRRHVERAGDGDIAIFRPFKLGSQPFPP